MSVGYTVLVLNIEAVGHNCWALEVYLLGRYLFKHYSSSKLSANMVRTCTEAV